MLLALSHDVLCKESVPQSPVSDNLKNGSTDNKSQYLDRVKIGNRGTIINQLTVTTNREEGERLN